MRMLGCAQFEQLHAGVSIYNSTSLESSFLSEVPERFCYSLHYCLVAMQSYSCLQLKVQELHAAHVFTFNLTFKYTLNLYAGDGAAHVEGDVEAVAAQGPAAPVPYNYP